MTGHRSFYAEVLTRAGVPITSVTTLTCTVVASQGVDTIGVRIAFVLVGRALVQFCTVELVYSAVPRQAFADVRPRCVDASSVHVAMVSLEPSLQFTLIHI